MGKTFVAVIVYAAAAVGLGLRISEGPGPGFGHARLPWAALMTFAVAAVIELRS